MAPKSGRSAGPPSWFDVLATQVRTRRKQLQLTQLQLAELAGCGPDFLYDVERGKPTLRVDKLLAVLHALGLELQVTGRGLHGG
ncbi:MAG: helix-turn-helix transcriptional regulator [Archangium sp.]|nr:helix-turn-helix transcriptional regulator [Archangium sp.]